jgi:hypothetical protein
MVLFPSTDPGQLAQLAKMPLKAFSKFALSGGRASSAGLSSLDASSAASDKINISDLSEFDSDLAGPVVYCLLLGCFLLLAGKVSDPDSILGKAGHSCHRFGFAD